METVFLPGHFSRAPCPVKISNSPPIFYNLNEILLGTCVKMDGAYAYLY